MMKILLTLAVAGGLLYWWWRRRHARSAAPPVPDTYVCNDCNENDCICQKDPAKDSGGES